VNVTVLDKAAEQRIEEAIAEVERTTASEIVVVTVPASDSYHDVRLLYAAACAPAVAALCHAAWPELHVPWLLWLQLPVAIVVMLASAAPGLVRLLVPASRMSAAAERRAHEEFLRQSIFATRERTGLLILLSELERRVVILGDKGIHAHVQDAGWNEHVKQIVRAIHDGDPARGVCDVIRAMGGILAEKLPVRPDDRNELPDAVRRPER
jgi:putative membrane protein